MPKKLHRKLSRQAKKKGLKGDRKDVYVYGTLTKIERKKSKTKKSRKK